MDLRMTSLTDTDITRAEKLMSDNKHSLFSHDTDDSQSSRKSIEEQNENQCSKIEKRKVIEGESNNSLVLCSKINLNDKQNKGSELHGVNIIKSSNALSHLEKTEKHVEKVVEIQEEKKEAADEVETIKKIAEMLGTNNINENNCKTKKCLQVLMSQNQSLQNWNSYDEIDASSSRIEINPLFQQVNADDAENKNSLIYAQSNKKRKGISDSQKTVDGSKTKEPSEEKFLEKSRFEEIEDKLEEMFAGIEDEQLINTTLYDKNTAKKSYDSSNKSLKNNCNITNADNKISLLTDSCIQFDSKSPNLLTSFENTKQLNLFGNSSIPKSMLYLKTMPPRRRLALGINKELLKLSVTSNDKRNVKNNNEDTKDEGDGSPLYLETHEDVKQIRKIVPKNKKKDNNKKKCSKYKTEMSYIKCNSYSRILKSKVPIASKQNQRKMKKARIQCLSSENDTDGKQLHNKEIDTKNRSPFILVKNRGTIAVINNVAPDESNEKFCRSKIPCKYVNERKTIKGCYSSTLGNRYDADTADSSWKCVFCKIGPHKKGLGDLFGPYIISSDCDEYRSTKVSFPMFRRSDGQHLNSTLSIMKETSNISIQNISVSCYDAGILQVSVDCYEVWVHEECAIWAPNIFVVGSRLAGLEEATWNSTRYECVYCLKRGALLCCLERDCKTTSHVPCAREFKWLFDESKLWVYCSIHAVKKNNNKIMTF